MLRQPTKSPWPTQRTPAVAHDFRAEMRIVREALDQSISRIRELLGSRDRAYVFSRYLETVLPEDALRSQLIKEQLSQDTPEESLFVLRNTFGAFLELTDGMLRLPRIPHRLYFAHLGMITREIGRNTYFNPLVTLEFRPEFDRIRSGHVLEVLHQTSDASHRVVALAFLSLFRSLRYVGLVDTYASNAATTRLAYVILSVFRSDLRALTRFLAHDSGKVISDALERIMLSLPAAQVRLRFDELATESENMVALRGTLENLANVLRVEVRKVFERDLPPPSTLNASQDLGPLMIVGAATLRATLHHSIERVCREVDPDSQGPALGSQALSRRELSERLRREVWMFSQVLRAFLAKAEVAESSSDKWAGYASFQWVKEFLHHFRAIGFQLARTSDYDRLDRFMAALDALRDVDLLDPARMRSAISECRQFYGYLQTLFRQVSKRKELAETPFDKREAAETLRIYLGAA